MDYTSDGMNIYFNQQWVDYTGLTLEESYGTGWINLSIWRPENVHGNIWQMLQTMLSIPWMSSVKRRYFGG
jgi:PAS domain-containing protein